MVKITWVRGFHRVLGRLSVIHQQLGGICKGDPVCILHLADSPGMNEYTDQLKKFDQIVLTLIKSKKLPLPELMKDTSLDSTEYSLIHLVRIANQESKIWERNLGDISLPVAVLAYDEWVMCDRMREAVSDIQNWLSEESAGRWYPRGGAALVSPSSTSELPKLDQITLLSNSATPERASPPGTWLRSQQPVSKSSRSE